MTKQSEKRISFEDALNELEEIAEKLERGQLTLEESIKAFERGMDLKKICIDRLKDAEGRIELLSNSNGEVVKEEIKSKKSSAPVKNEDLF